MIYKEKNKIYYLLSSLWSFKQLLRLYSTFILLIFCLCFCLWLFCICKLIWITLTGIASNKILTNRGASIVTCCYGICWKLTQGVVLKYTKLDVSVTDYVWVGNKTSLILSQKRTIKTNNILKKQKFRKYMTVYSWPFDATARFLFFWSIDIIVPINDDVTCKTNINDFVKHTWRHHSSILWQNSPHEMECQCADKQTEHLLCPGLKYNAPFHLSHPNSS